MKVKFGVFAKLSLRLLINYFSKTLSPTFYLQQLEDGRVLRTKRAV